MSAQSSGPCQTDRSISTLVGAGLGAAVGAIPATIVHRHDQPSSDRILIGSVAGGALVGFIAAGRDRPCASGADSSRVAHIVIHRRSTHAGHGALAGALIGGAIGAVGGTFYHTGCTREPCHETSTLRSLEVFSAAGGAVAGAVLGSLIGWAWPVEH